MAIIFKKLGHSFHAMDRQKQPVAASQVRSEKLKTATPLNPDSGKPYDQKPLNTSIQKLKPGARIAVLTPSLSGKLSAKWTGAVDANLDGRSWNLYSTAGLSILDGRNKTTRRAFEDGADWFWFLDDDTYPPRSAFENLSSHDLNIVSGVYTTRSRHPHVVFAHANEQDRYRWGQVEWSWPGDLFEVDVIGFGCMLVKRQVLEAIGEKDWYRWNWMRTLPSGKQIRQSKGEDVWFCEQSRRLGFKVLVDPNVRCQHIDRKTGISHPPKKFWEARRRQVCNEMYKTAPLRGKVVTPTSQKNLENIFTPTGEVNSRSGELLFDLIIPVSNIGEKDFPFRYKNLNKYILPRIPEYVNAIIVEQIIDDTLPTYKDHLNIPKNISYSYHHIEHPTFCKPWMYNVGVRHAKTDYLLLGEAECFPANYLTYFKDLNNWIIEKDAKWAIGWNACHFLPKNSKNKAKIIYPRPGGAEGGLVYFKADYFWEIGGYNEFMQGLGGMDNEIVVRAEKVTAKRLMFPAQMNHYWHPHNKMKGVSQRNKKIHQYTKAYPQKAIQYLSSVKQKLGDEVEGPVADIKILSLINSQKRFH